MRGAINTQLLGSRHIFFTDLDFELGKNNASRPNGEDFSFSMYRYDKFSISR